MKKDKLNNRLSDDNLKLLFKKQLPQAPRNPWFVRKVMNRLPAKGSSAYSWIEYAAYIIAIIAVIVGWWHVFAGIRQAGVITGGDLINILWLGGASTFIAISFIAPKVRRWLSEA